MSLVLPVPAFNILRDGIRDLRDPRSLKSLKTLGICEGVITPAAIGPQYFREAFQVHNA